MTHHHKALRPAPKSHRARPSNYCAFVHERGGAFLVLTVANDQMSVCVCVCVCVCEC